MGRGVGVPQTGGAMRFAIVGIVASGALLGCASAPAALPVRAGLTAEQLIADVETCETEADAADSATPMPYNDGTAGGAFGAGFAKGIADARAMNSARDACMTRLGYTEVALTQEQQDAFRDLRSVEDRAAYIAEFSAQSQQQ